MYFVYATSLSFHSKSAFVDVYICKQNMRLIKKIKALVYTEFNTLKYLNVWMCPFINLMLLEASWLIYDHIIVLFSCYYIISVYMMYHYL